MQTYHCAVAVGHYVRQLSAKTKSGTAYQPAAVLLALWLRAPDPFAVEVVVFVAAEHLAGIVPTAARLSQITRELREVGAISKERVSGGGYRLLKPPLGLLDKVARAEIARAQQLQEQAAELAGRAQELVRPVDARDDEDSEDAGARRRAALEACGKQLSDVRDGLATAMGLPRAQRNNLRFAGKGSLPVQFAADFVAANDWATFVRACKAARLDTSPDKPAEIKWLFAERNADYLARILGGA